LIAGTGSANGSTAKLRGLSALMNLPHRGIGIFDVAAKPVETPLMGFAHAAEVGGEAFCRLYPSYATSALRIDAPCKSVYS
jgi:hypothetical protein